MGATRIEVFGENRRKLIFTCPRREGRECHVLLKPWPINSPTWELSGSEDAPTLSPSINCGGCGWHGFIKNGVVE